jgi:nitroreductase
MELLEAIGRRRSIRFVKPHKPVEPEKIQRMLEAARIASHWGNVQSLRAVVVFRDTAPQETLDAIQAPIAGWQIRIAPVVIVWYIETQAIDEQADRLRELMRAGALGFGPMEQKQKALEEQVIPIFQGIGEQLKAPGLGELDCGQGIAQATLVAYEEGLGTCCLGTPFGDRIVKALGLPDSCRFLVLQTVGYPAEHWEAGRRGAHREEDVHRSRSASRARGGARVAQERSRPEGAGSALGEAACGNGTRAFSRT